MILGALNGEYGNNFTINDWSIRYLESHQSDEKIENNSVKFIFDFLISFFFSQQNHPIILKIPTSVKIK